MQLSRWIPSKVHGDIINTDWLSGILSDCVSRSLRSERVKEPLIFKDHIFLALAGLPANALDTLKTIIRTSEEFGDMSPEDREIKAFYDSISDLIGSDALSDLFLYHNIRDNLNYLQVRLGISSLEPRHYAIRDRLFSCQDYDQQMVLLPSDLATLELEAEKIATYFQLLTTRFLGCTTTRQRSRYQRALTWQGRRVSLIMLGFFLNLLIGDRKAAAGTSVHIQSA